MKLPKTNPPILIPINYKNLKKIKQQHSWDASLQVHTHYYSAQSLPDYVAAF